MVRKDEEDRQLRSVALQKGGSIFVARQHAQRQSEFYINEGQRLAHMGSWAFNTSGFFEYWSAELFHIYRVDSANGAPTLEKYLGLVHPQDRWWKVPVVILRSASCGPTASFGRFVPSVSPSSTTGNSKPSSAKSFLGDMPLLTRSVKSMRGRKPMNIAGKEVIS